MNSNEGRAYLPSCWEDEVRINAMFTVFRSKDLNPTGWQEKMNFWVNAILKFCKTSGKVSINASEVCTAFHRDRKVPKCINEVLDYMHKEGMTVPATEFKIDNSSSSWLDWGYNILKKPVYQSYSIFRSMLFEPKTEEPVEMRYVIYEVVQTVADRVFNRQKELEKLGDIDNIVEINDFKSRISDICSDRDFDFVLIQLRREKKALVLCDGGDCYIKFKSDDSDVIQSITEVDKAVVKLRKASETVDMEIQALDKEMGKCIAEAKEFLKAGNKNKAMLCLKRKKRLETAFNKKIISGENLENLMMQLKNTGSEKLILQAYGAGVDAMKSRVKTDFNIDKIDTIMNEFEETVGDISEIGAMMSKSFADEDLSDIEAELDELLAEDTTKITSSEKSADELHDELLRRLHSLKVPVGSPGQEKVSQQMM